jgi:hypothetical protein
LEGKRIEDWDKLKVFVYCDGKECSEYKSELFFDKKIVAEEEEKHSCTTMIPISITRNKAPKPDSNLQLQIPRRMKQKNPKKRKNVNKITNRKEPAKQRNSKKLVSMLRQ